MMRFGGGNKNNTGQRCDTAQGGRARAMTDKGAGLGLSMEEIDAGGTDVRNLVC